MREAATVLFRTLKLSGFGPYRDTVTCEMTSGINTLIARNETGKSSLVAGLVATIFGLPGKSDPQEFGRVRFKNWYSPLRFEGELEFEADGLRYVIRRDFESHKISLSVFENGIWKSLVSGEHNPNAIKRNAEYEGWLKKLFGIMSRELFEATFCVTQPLPETTKRDGEGQRELDKDVQQLLSGTGIAFAKAQDILLCDLKKQTKFTRQRGLTSRDQRTDGELEAIEVGITDLEAGLKEAKGVADSLEAVRGKLNSLTCELDAKSKELKGKQKTQDSLTEWRRLKSEYDQAALDLNRIEKALEDAESRSKEIIKEANELKRLYPEFDNPPKTLNDELDGLVSLKQELSVIGDTMRGIKSQLDANEAKKKEYEEAVSSFRNWGKLGKAPAAEVRARQRTAAGLMEGWKVFKADLGEQAECEEILRGELALIDNAKEEERKAFASYEVNLARLEREVAEAKRNLEDVEALFREFEASSLEYRENYKDIAYLPPDASSILVKKLQLMRAGDLLTRKSEEIKQKLAPPVWARIVGSVIFALLGWGISGSAIRTPMAPALGAAGGSLGIWIPMVIAAFLGCLGWFAVVPIWVLTHADLKNEEAELAAGLAGCKAETEEIDAFLGDVLESSDEVELGRLLERLSRRDHDREALDDREKRLPEEEERQAAEDEFSRIQNEYETFLERTAIFARKFHDVSAAYAKWNDVKDRKDKASERASEFAKRHFGCEPGAASLCVISSPDVSREWQEIADFVKIAMYGDCTANVGELIEFLESCDDAWWASVQGEVERYEELRRAEENLEAVMTEQKKRLISQEPERKQVETRYNEAKMQLTSILDAAGGDPELARKRWSDFRERKISLENKEELLKKIFDDHKITSVEELSLQVTKCRTRAFGAENRWQELIHKNPGLPGMQVADDPLKVDEYVRSLDAAVRGLEKEVSELLDSVNECRYELGALERESPLNIARAELELEEAKERREKIRLQADALTEAYLELELAVRDFHASCRTRLEEAATRHFQRITGVSDRAVKIDDDFQISLDVEGRPCDIAQLSKGAEDQLYISFRLAIADLVSSDINLPLIFDDPFVTCDSERLNNIGDALLRLADERQILILSHNETLADWGTPIVIIPDTRK
ncbi:MAG: AAA family ATPase [Firmicutes bacterium]|nr:AAA family ATPase [Bacillota bacterium]